MRCFGYLWKCFGCRCVDTKHLRRIDHDAAPDDETFDQPYQAAQAHLANLMTVSTLMLGFVLTGTVLSVGLTGHENYTSSDLYTFVVWSGLSAMFAASSLFLALLVSVRGSTTYTNTNAREAFMVVRYQQFWAFIAELCLYVGFLFFVLSLQEFMSMQFGGPDLCYMSDDTLREASPCAQVGADLFDGADKLCSNSTTGRRLQAPPGIGYLSRQQRLQSAHGARGSRSAMAAAYGASTSSMPFQSAMVAAYGASTTSMPPQSAMVAAYGASTTSMPSASPGVRGGRGGRKCPPGASWCNTDGPAPKSPEEEDTETLEAVCTLHDSVTEHGGWSGLYGYSIAFFPDEVTDDPELQDQFRLRAVVGAAQSMCDSNNLATAKDNACQDYNNPKCAELTVAWIQSEDCVDGLRADAERCYKICSRHNKNDLPIATQLQQLIEYGFWPVFACLLLVATLRTGCALHDLLVSCRHDLEIVDSGSEGECNGDDPSGAYGSRREFIGYMPSNGYMSPR